MATTITREATWYNVGKDIREANSVKEAMQIAGMDYEVVKVPIYLSNGFKVENQFATKKKGTNEVFGIVGKDYTVVQNEEAFSFVDSIIPEGLTFEKAGEEKYMNYIIASMPEQYILDDAFKPYIIFQNSHSGATTLKAAISPLRIICQNQFTMAFRKANNKIALRHGLSVNEKLNEAKNIMKVNAEYMNEFKKNAEAMATIKVDESTIEKVVNKYFVVDEEATTRKQNSIEEKKMVFMNAYNAEDNQNFKGSVYGLVNAFTDYITHIDPMRKTETSDFSKFVNVTFNNNLVENFMDIVKANV